MLKEIRANTSDIILKLLQKKLLDKNCEITEEEMFAAASDLDTRIKMLEYSLSRLKDDQRLIMELFKNVPEPETQD